MNTQAFKALVDKVLADHPSVEAEIFAYRLIIEVLQSAAMTTVERPVHRTGSRTKEAKYPFTCIECGTARLGKMPTQKMCNPLQNPNCRTKYNQRIYQAKYIKKIKSSV